MSRDECHVVLTTEGITLEAPQPICNELLDTTPSPTKPIVPADPRFHGLLSFAVGDGMKPMILDARDLASRLEWPDEPLPRKFRIRWSEEERKAWLPEVKLEQQGV